MRFSVRLVSFNVYPDGLQVVRHHRYRGRNYRDILWIDPAIWSDVWKYAFDSPGIAADLLEARRIRVRVWSYRG